MAQEVSRRPLTAEARVYARISPCEICGGQSDTGTGFSPKKQSVLMYTTYLTMYCSYKKLSRYAMQALRGRGVTAPNHS
jgi:hypothetical protein